MGMAGANGSETHPEGSEALTNSLLRSLTSSPPGDIASKLDRGLRLGLDFDHLDAVVYKEGTTEVQWTLGQMGSEVRAELTPSWWVYEHQQPLSIAEWSRDGRFAEFRGALQVVGSAPNSLLAVPLTSPHRRLGTLVVVSSARSAYSEEELRFVSLVADGLALAVDWALNVENARGAQWEVERQNERLKFLLDLTNRVTSNLDLYETVRATAASLRELMECDFVNVGLPTGDSGQHELIQEFPSGKRPYTERLLVSPTGALLRAFEERKPLLFTEMKAANLPPVLYELFINEGIRCVCLIPLVSRGRMLGALSIGRRREETFREEEIEFLMQIGGQIAIAIENALAFREILELKDKLSQEKLYLEEEIRDQMGFEQIVGQSAALRQVLELVEVVAETDATVLLLGESGTGKELIARAVHERSQRRSRTFVKLNCAAIPTGLLESELFGHEKGAFTGAIAQRQGRMELADQGTLFLDEVGDIPFEIQPKLLRALQEREFERLGSTQTRKVNVRLVAATNRDLKKMISDREFRADLYYRLNVFPILIPPLRERREDIPLLVSYFVQKYSRQMRKSIDSVPTTALKTITSWDWPGNIRELENFIERAVILTRGRSLDAPLSELRQTNSAPASVPPRDFTGREDVARLVRETLESLSIEKRRTPAYDENQRLEIVRVLRETSGRVGGADGAAARMGINRTTLISRMKKLDIQAHELR